MANLRTTKAKSREHSLRDSLEKRLGSYALAAGAAGAGLLALAQPAAAQIVYTPANQRLVPNHYLLIDLNNDGTTDISLDDELSYYTSGRNINLFAEGSPADEVITSHTNNALALPAGAPIGPSDAFSIVGFMAFRFREILGTTGSVGNWVNAKGRYLGVRFAINGQEHYGWARFDVVTTKGKIDALLTGYAYNTVPNQMILAGQTAGERQEGSISGPGLGQLALGSVGLSSRKGGK